MNKTVLYVLAAIIGVGLAVALFPKSETPDVGDVPVVGTEKTRSSKEPAVVHNPNLERRSKPAPTAETIKENPESFKPNDPTVARLEREGTPKGQHLLNTANKWQVMRMNLAGAGATELAEEAQGMMQKMTDLRIRSKSEYVLEELLTEEEELLGRIKAEVSDGAVSKSVSDIEASIADTRAASDPADG